MQTIEKIDQLRVAAKKTTCDHSKKPCIDRRKSLLSNLCIRAQANGQGNLQKQLPISINICSRLTHGISRLP